jgi:hypothetical protein
MPLCASDAAIAISASMALRSHSGAKTSRSLRPPPAAKILLADDVHPYRQQDGDAHSHDEQGELFHRSRLSGA